MREQIQALVERHLTSLRLEARAIDGDLRALGTGAVDLAGAARRAHTLKGSSGNLGFEEVSREAEIIERHLRWIAGGEDGAMPCGDIRAANARLQALVQRAVPADSTLYRRFS